ncbi:hypothetical protein VE03_10541, partial [Pseudogymnoascus sp. 23342-1-I1]
MQNPNIHDVILRGTYPVYQQEYYQHNGAINGGIAQSYPGSIPDTPSLNQQLGDPNSQDVWHIIDTLDVGDEFNNKWMGAESSPLAQCEVWVGSQEISFAEGVISSPSPWCPARTLSLTLVLGTRNLVFVYYQSRFVLAQYGQWDGYPEGQGFTILAFLRTPLNIERLKAGLAH